MTPPGWFQVGQAIPTSPWELVTHATRLTQLVLVILLVLSVISWFVMITKWVEMRRTDALARRFMGEFEKLSRLEQVRAVVRRSPPSAFTRIFTRAEEFIGGTRSSGGYEAVDSPAPGVAAPTQLSGSQVEALRLVLDSEVTLERDRLARFIPALAVIGSASPLIGLLGTVLGVIDAFLGIATRGSGNIGAVAPGVAEALIATAAALAVAIPATFGYNIFASRLNRVDGELDAFGTEIIAMMVREGHI